jgi:hypothetical protein
MKARLCTAVLIALAPCAVATADPRTFPDLSGYPTVDAHDYRTYFSYSTSGVQFVTPGGYRCRMSYVSKAARSSIACWGALPATTHNEVGVTYNGGVIAPGAFNDVNLANMESYQLLDSGGWHDGVVSPDAYKPLPAHSKVVFSEGSSETCAVDASMTACMIPGAAPGELHGFVLSPDGSWTL